MRIRPAIIIENEGCILLMRYSYAGKDLFQFPGGNADEGETMEQTLIRELKEELGISIEVTQMVLSAQVLHEGKNQMTLHCLFKGEIVGNNKPILNPKETTALEVVWKKIDTLESCNLYPSVGKAVRDALTNKASGINYLGLIDQPWL